MRGRTNIPPRIGGIVNGAIKQYQVADDEGIQIGDYVEFVAGTSPYVRTTLASTEYDIANDVKEAYGSGMWSTRLIELSDGKCCTFYVSTSSEEYITIELFEVINGTFISQEIILTQIVSNYLLTYPNFVCEIAQDEILLLLAPGTTYADGYVLKYDGIQFNTTHLVLNNELGTFAVTNGRQEKGMYKWSDELYTLPANDSIVTLRFSKDENALTFLSKTVVSTENMVYILGKYNGYLLVQIGKTALCTVSITDDGITTLIDTAIVPDNSYIGSQYIKLSDNTFFYLRGSFDASHTTGTKDLTVDVTVINVLNNGSLNVGSTTSHIYADCLYHNDFSNYKTDETVAIFYHEGIVFGVASGNGISTSSDTTYRDTTKELFTFPLNVSEDNIVSFGDIDVQRLPKDSSSKYIRGYNKCGRSCVREDGSVYILTRERLTYGKPVYFLKPSKQGLSNLYTADLVKRYKTKILGIAKTAGLKDEMIEVYIPE